MSIEISNCPGCGFVISPYQPVIQKNRRAGIPNHMFAEMFQLSASCCPNCYMTHMNHALIKSHYVTDAAIQARKQQRLERESLEDQDDDKKQIEEDTKTQPVEVEPVEHPVDDQPVEMQQEEMRDDNEGDREGEQEKERDAEPITRQETEYDPNSEEEE